MTSDDQVLNQSPPLEDYNLYTTDPILDAAIDAEGGAGSRPELVEYGARAGAAETFEWGFLANRNEPVLRTHDRYGNRLDHVDFHPAWHSLMDMAVTNGLHSLPWEDQDREDGQVARAGLLYMSSQVEAGHFCPVSMTTSVVPALRIEGSVASEWVPRVLSRSYDPTFQPAGAKAGALMGMGMTEKQGGSDVRANRTTARPRDGSGPGSSYRVDGHKWFTSAPMCDAFLVLAQAPGGLSCLLMPRWRPDGSINGIRIQRLKDKLGNRANASSEVEFIDAHAVLIGEEGRGVPTIIEMVNGTRLDCVIGSAAQMRQAVAQAAWHVAHRRAFGSKLIDKPLMQNVIADLEIEVEVATLMMARLAGSFDRAPDDGDEANFRRVALPLAKFWVTKQATGVVREAMECLGGNGYVEESILPRLFRESPLNAIWEGSGNVIALDFLRASQRVRAGLDSFIAELEIAASHDVAAVRAIEAAKELLSSDAPETEARRIVEALARAWGAALVIKHGDDHLIGGYTGSRLGDRAFSQYGAMSAHLPLEALARRAVPAVGS